jgi:hypothetical protein
MKKESDLFFEPSDIDMKIIVAMVFCCIISLGCGAYAFWGYSASRMPGYFIASVICWLISASSLTFALFVKFHGIYTKPNRRYLMKTGIRVPTKFTAIKKMESLSSRADPRYIGEGKWTCPYVVITTGINPVTGREMRFESDYIEADPLGHLEQGEELDVYVDPKKPDRYFMDLTPLQDKLGALLKKAGQRYEIG